ncbi:MAG: hypothetical protein Q9209_001763 [Squamulea sp. 1 TL-2023]
MAPHVCIIGAGVSGLRCATVLLEHSYDVTIIEARNRIGGRIAQSDQMGPLEVDIGANWVHSTGHNPIIELAKETGTPLHLWKENTLLVDSEGQLIPPAEANQALKQVWEILDKASEYSTNLGDKVHPSASLYDFFENTCDRAVKCGEMSERERELILGMSQMWGAYVGDGKIVARIAALPLARAKMCFNISMTSVAAQQDGSRSVCVTTSDGKAQYFDDVVITTPLGWLKQHKESIDQLHPRITSAIDSISFGRLEKVNPSRWRLECVSFHAFEAPYRRNVLLFYTFGDCSTHITSSIKGLHGEARDRWLQGFFEPYYSALPGYEEACTPLRFLATEWCNDELAGNGCYSNFQAGMSDAARDVEVIRHGMPEQHIYFAGEHTAPFDGLGTVAGAYNSGEKIARRIVEGG